MEFDPLLWVIPAGSGRSKAAPLGIALPVNACLCQPWLPPGGSRGLSGCKPQGRRACKYGQWVEHPRRHGGGLYNMDMGWTATPRSHEGRISTMIYPEHTYTNTKHSLFLQGSRFQLAWETFASPAPFRRSVPTSRVDGPLLFGHLVDLRNRMATGSVEPGAEPWTLGVLLLFLVAIRYVSWAEVSWHVALAPKKSCMHACIYAIIVSYPYPPSQSDLRAHSAHCAFISTAPREGSASEGEVLCNARDGAAALRCCATA